MGALPSLEVSKCYWYNSTSSFIEATGFFGGGLSEEGRASRVAQIPVGRPGRPEEVAGAVAYLASPEAAYVNGEVHHVNGGWLFGR